MMEDRKSWAVKDEAILNDLQTLMGVSEADEKILTALQEQAKTISSDLIEAFYNRLLSHEPTAEYIADEKMAGNLKITLENWFLRLFQGNYDKEYVQDRLKIGQVHVRIGLPVRYPLAMMDLLLEFGGKVTAQSDQPEQATIIFYKLMAIDIAIFNQAYEDSQLKHLAEMMGNERLARRLLIQGG